MKKPIKLTEMERLEIMENAKTALIRWCRHQPMNEMHRKILEPPAMTRLRLIQKIKNRIKLTLGIKVKEDWPF